LIMVYDETAEAFEKAIHLRPNLTCGQKPWSKWGLITSPRHAAEARWFQKFGLFRMNFLSLFDTVENQIRMLRRLDVDILDGYASSIYLVAKELLNGEHYGIHPKLVYTTAEMLTEKMREVIHSAFDFNPLDQFGCVELGRTAWECTEHVGYHIDMDAVVMEFIHDGEIVNSNESGEIVYTGLYNYAMPLIRYRVGDVGVPSDEICPCGRRLPLMKCLEGRKDAFIKIPSGRIFSPIIWAILMKPYELNHFKVIQEKIDKINVLLVPSISFTEENLFMLNNDIKNVLGQEVEIDITLVEKISREKSGKIRSVVSKI